MQVTNAIKTLGGPSKVAMLLGLSVTTVQYWFYENHIPKWRRADLERLIAEQPPAEPAKSRKKRRSAT